MPSFDPGGIRQEAVARIEIEPASPVSGPTRSRTRRRARRGPTARPQVSGRLAFGGQLRAVGGVSFAALHGVAHKLQKIVPAVMPFVEYVVHALGEARAVALV